MEESSGRPFVAPYIAYRTFKDLIKRMEDSEPPARIDKSYLSNYAGGYQSQIMAALRSLGLIGSDGVLDPSFKEMVQNPNQRPQILHSILEGHFPEVFQLSKNATQAQLEETFSQYGVTGNTRRKAIAFFLSAANEAGISLSPHFRTPKVSAVSGGRRGRPKKTRDEPELEEEHDPTLANTYEVFLEEAGKVTLTAQIDVFRMTKRDREFFFGLVDQMEAYREQMLKREDVRIEAEELG